MGDPGESGEPGEPAGPGGDEVEFGQGRSRRRRPVPSWLVLAVALAAAAAIAVRSAPHRVPAGAAVSVTFTGRPILGVRASWEVLAHGPRDLVAIDLAQGKITITLLPAAVGGGP
jgi:hypothetical protein